MTAAALARREEDRREADLKRREADLKLLADRLEADRAIEADIAATSRTPWQRQPPLRRRP